jgi:hypothetical protein
LPPTTLRVVRLMSQHSQISSHLLTPRWTHAIDVRAESRRDESIRTAAVTSSLQAALRDQAVPRPPVPMADVKRRTPVRQRNHTPVKGPTPLSVPQEIESIPEQEADSHLSAAVRKTDY